MGSDTSKIIDRYSVGYMEIFYRNLETHMLQYELILELWKQDKIYVKYSVKDDDAKVSFGIAKISKKQITKVLNPFFKKQRDNITSSNQKITDLGYMLSCDNKLFSFAPKYHFKFKKNFELLFDGGSTIKMQNSFINDGLISCEFLQDYDGPTKYMPLMLPSKNETDKSPDMSKYHVIDAFGNEIHKGDYVMIGFASKISFGIFDKTHITGNSLYFTSIKTSDTTFIYTNAFDLLNSIPNERLIKFDKTNDIAKSLMMSKLYAQPK